MVLQKGGVSFANKAVAAVRVSPRIYAGDRARALRDREGLRQSQMAARLEISVSYLSQIEANDRPITPAVLAAFAREFPGDWELIGSDSEAALVAHALTCVEDQGVGSEAIDASALQGAVKRYPQLVRRLVATHQAYQRTQEQLRILDDRLAIGTHTSGQLPWEEVRDWFHAAQNYVDPLDRAAEDLDASLPPNHPRARMEEALRALGVSVGNLAPGQALLRSFDPETRLMLIDQSQAPETTLFSLARQLMKLTFPHEFERLSDSSTRSGAARALLSAGLENYAAGALLMPYRRFRAAAASLRHDVDHLRTLFGTSFEQTCHRLSTLQRPGEQGTPVFFCRVDMAGNVTKRHSATRLQFAQSGGACPLWIAHEAVAIPDRILVQLAETPDGTRYVAMAKGLVKPSSSFMRTPRRYAVTLGCEVTHASSFIYADGLQQASAATPIGNSCWVCPRGDCEQRAFPPAGSDIGVDPDRRGLVPYSFS